MRLALRPLASALAVLTVALVLLSTAASPARADVAYRSCSEDDGTAVALVLFLGTSFSMAAPPGVQNGDVIMLTVTQSQAWGIIFNFFTTPEGQSRAWTPVQTSGNTRTYYRVRQAGDPASYTLFSPLFGVAATVSISATMSAFTGADTANPITGGETQSTASGFGPHTLPNAPVARHGSMRYQGSATDVSSTFSYGAPLAAGCTNSTSARSTSGAHEAVNPTATASRQVTLAGAAGPTAAFQTQVIQPPTPPCTPGSLTLDTQPASVTFPATVLNGIDQTRPGLAAFRVSDYTEAHIGWRLSATSTTFTNGGGQTLPTTATRVTGAAGTAAPGNCSLPVNGVTYPLVLPAAAAAPAAVTVMRAADNTGAGPSNVDLALSLLIPSNTRTGTYTSTWTFTLAAGP